ncbi:hypothetical protein Tco_0736252 [Tanacetum coccineum]
MKLESLVIADQHAAVNMYPGPVHTTRHTLGIGSRRGTCGWIESFTIESTDRNCPPIQLYVTTVLYGLGKSPKLQERKIELALIGKEGTMRDALIGKRLSLDLTFPIGFDCAFMKAFIEESKESTQSRAEKGGAKCRDKATEDSDFLLANRAQYKRMELNLPLKKDICLTQAFRSHFLLKEDRKKLKVEKEGSDVYEQNEPQIEKADQGELQLQLSIGVLRWERK